MGGYNDIIGIYAGLAGGIPVNFGVASHNEFTCSGWLISLVVNQCAAFE